MQPGLSRAIPMGIIGFMFGALIVIVLRGLQGLDPIWAPGPGIVLSALTTAAFFVWGMGAFDPRMSVHGEAAEEAAHEELAAEAEKPVSILASYTWQITTVLLLFLIILGGFAVLPGGFTLTQTVVPGASPSIVGYADVPLPFGGPTIQVSTLVIFAVFVIWSLISLLAAAWLLYYLFTSLTRGLAEVKTTGGGAALLPAPARQEPTERDLLSTIKTVVLFVVTFVILYLLFYYVAIGLILPEPQLPGLSLFLTPAQTLVFLSLVNAIIFTFVILRPALVLRTVGRVAKWLAYQLRRIPNILQ